MRLQESGEMYLETILTLSKKLNVVRSIDICEAMGYSKPSVSRAMSRLKSEKYIIMDKNGFIALTETGRKTAEKIYERHTVLTEFIESLGVDKETAVNDACKIEHVISDDTFSAVKAYMKK